MNTELLYCEHVMGLLQNGTWVDNWYPTNENEGKFIRELSQFRHFITEANDSVSQHAIPHKNTEALPRFIAEPNRYHLIVSLACPWAHRTLIFRQLKQLQSYIDITIVEPHMLNKGWQFSGKSSENFFDLNYVYQLYAQVDKDYTGRVTVPILWDTYTHTIVSNESADIIRMFNSAFNSLTGNVDDYYPVSLKRSIDEVNEWIYHDINNGVYKAGFATSQQAYEEAFNRLFTALDKVEKLLNKQRYIVGSTLTEADWRLFTTLIRFDCVYVGHFKTNLKRIADYPAIQGYLKELYQYPGIAETVDFEHIKQHYYYSHDQLNPTRIVPIGPELDLLSAHGRDRWFA